MQSSKSSYRIKVPEHFLDLLDGAVTEHHEQLFSVFHENDGIFGENTLTTFNVFHLSVLDAVSSKIELLADHL